MRILRHNTKINWADPLADYDRIYQMREDNLKLIRKKPGAIPALLAYYADGHWAEFISDWGMTYDPRETDPRLKHRPFILYPRQVDLVQWTYERYIRREKGLLEKFRGCGFTWLGAAMAATLWLTTPMAIVGFGSRKKELVDNGPADPDSILWKVRQFIDELPALFLPPEYDAGRKWGVIPNVSNGATVKGEIGDEIGRGGRSSIYFADEYAHLEHQEMAEAALSENADCVIFGSTVNGVGNNFYRLRHFLPDEQVFVFDWTEDERKRLNPQLPAEEEPWFKKKKSEVSPTVFASQYLRKYDASVANSFISDELISEAFSRSKVSLTETRANWRIGVDASGMGNDKTVIWRRRGRLNLPAIVLEKLDGVQLAAIVEREARALLSSGPVELISLEQDGPGGSAADVLRYGAFSKIVVSVHTGAKLGDGHNYNLRAMLHAEAKGYLEGELPIIPPDEIFRTQATALQFSYKNGLLLLESKEEYRARFSGGRTRVEKASGKSPDRWDAFVLTFVPPRAKPIASLKSSLSTATSTWRPLDTALGY